MLPPMRQERERARRILCQRRHCHILMRAAMSERADTSAQDIRVFILHARCLRDIVWQRAYLRHAIMMPKNIRLRH